MSDKLEQRYSIVTNETSTALATIMDWAARGQADLAKARQLGDEAGKLLVTASLMVKIEQLLTDDLLRPIMALQGSPLGFTTDKDKVFRKDEAGNMVTGYPLPVVRKATMYAIARGVRLTGGELHIISERPMAGWRFYHRHIKENIPGVTEFDAKFGDMELRKEGGQNTAFFHAWATWKQDGKRMRRECNLVERDGQKYDERIKVRINDGMGRDGAEGKAKRHLFMLLIEEMEGVPVPEDSEDANTVDAESVSASEEPLTDEQAFEKAKAEAEAADKATTTKGPKGQKPLL